MARPELLELRPSWGGGMVERDDCAARAARRAGRGSCSTSLGEDDRGGAERRRIAAAADGNPFFVEEMVDARPRRARTVDVEVPPTIRALLDARLDQLDGAERAVLERGSVEGQIFHRGAVESMADGESQGERLTALVRKQLVRPDRPQVPHEDAYRFRHLLIRDAAYDAVPEEVTRGSPSPLRRLARAPRARPRRARGDPWLPPRAGRGLPRRPWPFRPGAGR